VQAPQQASTGAQPAAVEKPASGAETAHTTMSAAEKRIARFGVTVLDEGEKAKRREERFKTGDPLSDTNKMESRAARFGILTEQALKEKELARAKRFGVDTPELVEQKKRAREERFSQSVPQKQAHTVSELEGMIHKRS
jgi:hypothetical protein